MRAKPLVVTVVVLAVVAGVAFCADYVVRDQAEQQVAKAVQTSLGLESAPEVELGGVSFLVALVTRQVSDASLTAADVPLEVSGKLVSLTSVHATARDISLRGQQVELGSANVDAVLSYDALSTMAEAPVQPAGDGRLTISYTADLFGQSLAVAVSGLPVLDAAGQQVRLTDPTVDIPGFPLGADVAQTILNQVIQPIPLKLPYDVKPDGLSVQPDGVVLTASAAGLTFPLP
jgi:hypothetical protein